MSVTSGRSVKIFLADGTATGIITAEIMNWTGHVVASPRTRFEDAIKRSELKRTGIYLLIGSSDEANGQESVYVGEGDEIGKRLISHSRDKDFWERFVAVTSKDMNLTKAHVRYLESRLIELLEKAKKVRVENKDRPRFDLLPEGDISDMETFLEEVQLVLPVIGIDFLKRPQISQKMTTGDTKPASNYNPKFDRVDPKKPAEMLFKVSNEKAGILGFAKEEAGEFVVLAGSQGSLKEKVSFGEKQRQARSLAMKNGIIKPEGSKNFRLVEDMSFSSPSAASVFLFGTSRNGRTDWVVESLQITYGEWKDELIKLVETEFETEDLF